MSQEARAKLFTVCAAVLTVAAGACWYWGGPLWLLEALGGAGVVCWWNADD